MPSKNKNTIRRSKNKNIIRRSKTRKQHRSRKHKRNNNNNARNQTIRGGWRWPWRKPTPTLMSRIIERNKDFGPVKEKNPERTDLMSPSSQPRLPTNVRAVTTPLHEDVSTGNRDYINGLKTHIEPLVKQKDDLAGKKEQLVERLERLRQDTSRENREARRLNRQEIRTEILKINTEIREIETKIRPILRNIERMQITDHKYREDHELPEVPLDVIPDAAIEMEKVDDAAGVFGLRLDKEASGTNAALVAQGRIAQTNQDDLIDAMSRMSVHRDSTPPRGSSARDAPLPPSGLPSGHRRARDSSARGSPARGSRRSGSP